MKRRKNESTAAFIRRRERNKAATCRCSGWWFPHRRGSQSSDYLFERGIPGCLTTQSLSDKETEEQLKDWDRGNRLIGDPFDVLGD